MTTPDYDLCVIGGGINGAGIARDAAGRGLRFLLVEADDLGSATSSSSTKLIHGGLRYLEYFEFRLVREALKEREVLLSMAPHIIKPMTFILPRAQETGQGEVKQRPAWLVRLGLFLYDHLAKRKELPASGYINFDHYEYGAPLARNYPSGFYYADCWADDSRLVVLNAMSAAQKGATILTRTSCEQVVRHEKYWEILCRPCAHSDKDNSKQDDFTVTASMVINAAGPWVQNVIDSSSVARPNSLAPKVRLVKGSHIIVKRQYEGEQAYLLPQPDHRIIFAIPYENDYTLIGTTEEEFSGSPREAHISDFEFEYLIEAYNRFFEQKIQKDDVLWTYSGVRPLFEDRDSVKADARSVSRDYKLHIHGFHDLKEDKNIAPMLSVFGGKLTTYRKLAEQAVDKILHVENRYAALYARHWTANEALPGGEFAHRTDPVAAFQNFLAQQQQVYPWLPETLLYRYARCYGSLMDLVLGDAKGIRDLGKDFGYGFYEAELDYLLRHEFVKTAEDVLWRRTKLGVHMRDEDFPRVIEDINAFIDAHE